MKQKSQSQKEKVLDSLKLYEETITEYDDYSSHLNKIISDKDIELEKLNHKIQDIIQKQEQEISEILKPILKKFLADRTDVAEKENEIEELQNKIESLKESHNNEIKSYENMLSKERKIIGEFRSSISYPFYKVSSSIGKSELGRILQKLLK